KLATQGTGDGRRVGRPDQTSPMLAKSSVATGRAPGALSCRRYPAGRLARRAGRLYAANRPRGLSAWRLSSLRPKPAGALAAGRELGRPASRAPLDRCGAPAIDLPTNHRQGDAGWRKRNITDPGVERLPRGHAWPWARDVADRCRGARLAAAAVEIRADIDHRSPHQLRSARPHRIRT